MSETRKQPKPADHPDTDVLAVRSLLDGHSGAMTRSGRAVEPDMRDRGAGGQIRQFRTTGASKAAILPALAAAEPDSDPQSDGASAVIGRASAQAVDGVRNYRPQSRIILRTSLILMLLLQPVFLITSFVITVVLTIVCYFWAGRERFWGKVLTSYRTLAKYQPTIARSLKLRAYVISRRWDAFIGRLPQRLADALRCPDLRGLAKAEEQHMNALNDRLNRLA